MFKVNDENLLLFSSQFVKQKEYWSKKLSGDIKETKLSFDLNKSKAQKPQASPAETGKKKIAIHIPPEVSSRLIKLSKNLDVSIYIILLTCLKSLIYRYTDNEDITVLSPVYQAKVTEETINSCVFIRDRVTAGITFKELILAVRESVLEAYENQDYPFDKLNEYLFNIPGTGNKQSNTEIACTLRNIHDDSDIKEIKSHLVFSFARDEDRVEGAVLYDQGLYEDYYIEQISNHFLEILGEFMPDVKIKISQPGLLSEEERKRLLFEFNETKAAWPGKSTMIELIEEQVDKTPDNIAVIYENKKLKYKELNEKANQLGRVLREKGVKADTIVGIYVKPTAAMVLGITAILKAGGAYLPIESETPADRINYMLEDCKADIVLTHKDLIGKLEFSGEIINIENEKIYENKESSNPDHINRPGDLIYLIYTSGTTGKPKGVLIKNENLVNYITWFIEIIRVTGKDKAILTSSFAFDALYTQFYASLIKGCELHVISSDTLVLAGSLLKYLKDSEITYIKVTPSLFNLIVNSPDFSNEMFKRIRFIMIGGEQIKVEDVAKAHEICDHIPIMNHYGPTETTIGSIARFIDFARFDEYRVNPTIGKPIYNTFTYILDKNLEPVPLGVAGELYIGGMGVGPGYMNKPELTADKFDHNKKNKSFCGGSRGAVFSKSAPLAAGGNLYKTGDLARWEPDGNIKLMGRIDNQVKIRGYRIELGEIENRLMANKDIKETVVTAREEQDGEKYLCAYFVPAGTGKERGLNVSELREYLGEKLPNYMIPSFFVQLEKIPLTPHNKIDFKALPEPKDMVKTGRTYEPPINEAEEKIILTWSEILNVSQKKIGRNDDFFELGGNSLNILKALNRINKVFELEISLSALFLHTTVKELAANIYEKGLLNKLECIIKMNNGRNKKNIFIVHPRHGMVYQYKELARLLENEFNIYAIQARGVDKKSWMPEDINVMAADYVDQLRQVQKQGPYLIIGFCLGDMVAYNIVKLLEDMECTVDKFVMFDERPFIPKQLVKYHLRKERIEQIKKFFITRTRKKPYKHPNVVEYERLVKEIRQRDEEQKNTNRKLSPEETEKQKEKVEENLKMVIGKYFGGSPYRGRLLGIINAPVLDIKAEERGFELYPVDELKIMTKGEFQLTECPGGHDSMLESPNVEKMVEIFRNYL